MTGSSMPRVAIAEILFGTFSSKEKVHERRPFEAPLQFSFSTGL
jgi:hypothetical protein